MLLYLYCTWPSTYKVQTKRSPMHAYHSQSMTCLLCMYTYVPITDACMSVYTTSYWKYCVDQTHLRTYLPVATYIILTGSWSLINQFCFVCAFALLVKRLQILLAMYIGIMHEYSSLVEYSFLTKWILWYSYKIHCITRVGQLNSISVLLRLERLFIQLN